MNRISAGGSQGLRRTIAAAALSCMVCVGLSSQAQASSGSDLDGLFNDTGAATTTPPAGGASAPPSDQPSPAASVRTDDITQDKSIHYFGSLAVYGLVGLGWSPLPSPSRLDDGLGNEGSGSLMASLGVEVRPAAELRFRATMSYTFPTPGTQLSELIVDYSIHNNLFFRFGIFDYTWGNSQFFQFSNLPARGLPEWSLENEALWQRTNILQKTSTTNLPVTMKMSVPFGVNNLTLLARFDMANYGFPDTATPDPLYAGYGIQYDLVTGPIEWSLAGFYQYRLNPRTSLGMKTSFLGFDFSAEATMAFPVTLTFQRADWKETAGGGIPVGGGNRIYPTAMLGLSREWTESRIKLYAEYAFNGEADPGISWLTDSTGPGGHNSAVVVRFADLGESDFSLNVLWQQNWSDGSGLVSPLLEMSPARLATLQFGPVLVFGPDDSAVIGNRLVPGHKRLEFLFLLKISENYRQ